MTAVFRKLSATMSPSRTPGFLSAFSFEPIDSVVCTNEHVATLVDSDWIATDCDTNVVVMPGITPSTVITGLAHTRRRWMISTNRGTWHIPDTHMFEVAIGNEVAAVAMIPTVCRIRNKDKSLNILGVVGKFKSGAVALFPVDSTLYPHGDDTSVVSLRDTLSKMPGDSPMYAYLPPVAPLNTDNYAEVMSNWMIAWKQAPWEMDVDDGIPAGWNADFEFLITEYDKIQQEKKAVEEEDDSSPTMEEDEEEFVMNADAPTFGSADPLKGLKDPKVVKPSKGKTSFRGKTLAAALKESKKAKYDDNDGFAPLKAMTASVKQQKLLT